MSKIIQRGLVLLVFAVPLIFNHATTEVYGLIKWTLLEMGVLALLVLWLISLGVVPSRAVLKKQPSGTDPIRISLTGWAILTFFCIAIFSLIKTTNIHEAIAAVYQLGAGAGLFFLIINNLRERKGVNQIVSGIILAGVITCLFSLYENRGIKLDSLRFAYTSTFGNPIFFAQYLSLAIILSLAMCCYKDNARHIFSRVGFGLSAVFMLVFLVLTRSRGAYLGLGMALLYCYILFISRCSKRLRRVLIWALIGCLLISVLAIRGWVGAGMRFRNLMRIHLWGSTYQMVKDNPILGVGIGNFKVVYPLYRSPEEKEVTPKGVTYTKAHNDFLQIWAEMGTLGLVCFLWILFSLLAGGSAVPARASPAQKQSMQETCPSAHISLGLSAGLLAFLVQAFFNPVLYIPASAMGFWVLLGLISLKRRR